MIASESILYGLAMPSARAIVGPYLQREYLRLGLVVLIVCFAAGKLGQYLFMYTGTSPAVFWPQFGIALAALYFGGYRMWLPVALAAILTLVGRESSLLVMFAKTAGQTIQPLVGAYALHRLGYTGTVRRMRDIVSLSAVALFATMIAPTISLGVQYLIGSLAGPLSLLWSRAWIGGLFSVLLLMPLFSSWITAKKETITRARKFELALAGSALLAICYMVSFTPYTQLLGFPLAYALFAALTWFAMRFPARATTIALFLTSATLIAGSITTYTGPLTLGERLFQIELFSIFIVVLYLIVAALIEERRSAEARSQGYVRELEEALRRISSEDRAKNEFIATLAHELRNPLSPIMSTLEVLLHKDQSADVRELVESALSQTKNMRRLLDDLLDAARVAQKKFKLQKETVPINTVVARSVESVHVLMRNRSHTVSISLPEKPIFLDADPVRLEQILVNLLNNAAKYTHEGGRIELHVQEEGPELVLRIKDNGIGIAKDDLARIWIPFRQIARKEGAPGLGIGLSITRRLVRMHGGKITATSDGPTMGTTFTVRLPVAPMQDIVDAPANAPSEKSEYENTHNILVIDDNAAAADGLNKLLTLKGHRVDVAYSGKDALEATRFGSHEIVLLDIGLPDIDGYEVARHMRSRGVNAFIIALTGYGQDEDKSRALQAGFDLHLTKPVGLRELEEVFRKLPMLARGTEVRGTTPAANMTREHLAQV